MEQGERAAGGPQDGTGDGGERSDGSDPRDVSQTALYVFCLAPASAEHLVAGLQTGSVDGECIVSLRLADASPDLIAVCCAVEHEQWIAEAERRDPMWLGPRAIRHQEVLEQLMEAGPVLPLRFGRVFAGAKALRACIAQKHQSIAAFFERGERSARGGPLQEWSLVGELLPGGCIDEARAAALEIVEPGAIVIEYRELELPASREGGPDVGLRWALLLPAARVAELVQRLEEREGELEARGLVLEARGPWPPFSFAPAIEPEL